jgi:hypothetical protein
MEALKTKKGIQYKQTQYKLLRSSLTQPHPEATYTLTEQSISISEMPQLEGNT